MTPRTPHRRFVEFFLGFLSSIIGGKVVLHRLSGPRQTNGHDLEIKTLSEVRGYRIDARSFFWPDVERDTGGIEQVLQLESIRQTPDGANRD
jgi:hypothetical protein